LNLGGRFLFKGLLSKNFKKALSILLISTLIITTASVPVKTTASLLDNLPVTDEDYQTASDNAYQWLKRQQDSAKLDSGEISGLVDSFEDFSGPNTPLTDAYTYDQAIAAIAFLIKGDIPRAQKVLDVMKKLQAPDGSWVNSYYYGGLWGGELRKHVGPATWIAIAIENYEKITGDTTTYHNVAIKALDWCLKYQRPNGGVAGGETNWDVPNTWTNEPWTSTEHNINLYPTLKYFASNTAEKSAAYNTAADKVKGFLDNVVWDSTKNRFYGGFKNDTQLRDPFVPLDVNPWGVMALGLTDGVRDYSASLDYVENAAGDPVTGQGTLENPRYVHTLTYNDAGDLMTLYDFDWESDHSPGDPKWGGGFHDADIWFEGSAFMSCAYYMRGDIYKSNSILNEIIKKQGTSGASLGGIPYCLKGTQNNYWRMIQQNCVSSTGWLIIAAARWNPYTASTLDQGDVVGAPTFNLTSGTYPSTQNVIISCATEGATIRYTTDGTQPTETSAEYTGAIIVSTSRVIKARAFKTEMKNSVVVSANYIISDTVATPVVNPLTGTYRSGLQVEISCPTNGATIRYTTDNSVPTEVSPVYIEPITLSTSTTIKAIAVRAGFKNSPVVSNTYTITVPAATPTFSVAGGNYTSPRSVAIICATEGATIRYSTNGSDPTEASPIYTGPITVSATTTVKAYASKAGMAASDIASVTYTITAPEYTTGMEQVNSTTAVIYLSGQIDWADIHYTVNAGGQQNVRMIKNSGTGRLEQTLTGIKAGDVIRCNFTYAGPNGVKDSEWATYTVGNAEPSNKVSTPTFSVAGGNYSSPQTISLSCDTDGAEIRYTLDNTVPGPNSTKYNGPISVATTTTIKAYALKTGMEFSSIASATYTIGTQQSGSGVDKIDSTTAVIYLSGNISWADVHYKINETGQQNVRMVLNTATGRLEHRLTGLKSGDVIRYNFTYQDASGVKDSLWVSYTFQNTPPIEVAAAPTFSIAEGTYTSAQTVTLSSSTSGAIIRYTLDGTTPTAASPAYTAPITISATTMLKAYAVKAGMTDSNVVTANYVISIPGDINQDGTVDLLDLTPISTYYNYRSGQTNWNAVYDLNDDGIIDIYDIVFLSELIE
jgi:hypothetical protein